MEKYTVLGIMSGSSLDGVDLACCEFARNTESKWEYRIIQAETAVYDEAWIRILKDLPFADGRNLVKYDIEYGKKLAEISGAFISKYNLKPDFISSHGHTIFHNPEEGYTFQLGNGQALASASAYKIICDFRIKDIQMGGQGAPLVPIGDEILFPEYDICLNLGGIANISFRKEDKRLAFDVCPANQLLNYLANQKGLEYDKEGKLAKSGTVKTKLFDALNNQAYYRRNYPKSLGNEYVRNEFIPVIDQFKTSVENKLATVVEHIAFQISAATVHLPKGIIISTGGGVYNSFLINRLKKLSKHEIHLPDSKLIDFKEAMIFGLLGVLKMRDEINCLSSVTGATKDSCIGAIYTP